MAQEEMPCQYSLGLNLLTDSESFIRDLTEEDESSIMGGKRSRTNTKKRRKRRKRRNRRNRRKNNSST